MDTPGSPPLTPPRRVADCHTWRRRSPLGPVAARAREPAGSIGFDAEGLEEDQGPKVPWTSWSWLEELPEIVEPVSVEPGPLR